METQVPQEKPLKRKNKMNDEFTLEKLKVSERLHEVEIALTKFIERFDAHTEQDRVTAERITKIIETHDKIILGANGHDGMKLEVDRLKQRSAMLSFVLGAITVAVIGLLTKTIWAAFSLAT
jgi:hypothetical protein